MHAAPIIDRDTEQRLRQTFLKDLVSVGNNRGIVVFERESLAQYFNQDNWGALIGILIRHLGTAKFMTDGSRARFDIPKLGLIDCRFKAGRQMERIKNHRVLLIS